MRQIITSLIVICSLCVACAQKGNQAAPNTARLQTYDAYLTRVSTEITVPELPAEIRTLCEQYRATADPEKKLTLFSDALSALNGSPGNLDMTTKETRISDSTWSQLFGVSVRTQQLPDNNYRIQEYDIGGTGQLGSPRSGAIVEIYKGYIMRVQVAGTIG